MKRRFSLLAAAVLLSAGLSVGASVTASGSVAPTVDGIEPNSGSTAGATQVVIFGSGFNAATRVNFGGSPIFRFFTVDDHRIITSSPPGAAGTIDVTVSAGTISSATNPGDRFTYKVVPPRVDAVDPRRGTAAGGTGVTILGQGLSGAIEVHFGTVRVPCGPGPGFSPAKANALRLERAVSDAAVQQRASGSPAGPASGSAGGPGGGPGSCIPIGEQGFFVNSPPGTAGSTVDVTVTTGAGTSSPGPGTKFSYVAPTAPIVNAVGPNHGTANGGTNVTIYGSGLSGATKVNFGPSVVNACPTFAPATPSSRGEIRIAPGKTVRQPFVPAGGGGGGPGLCFFSSGSDTVLSLTSPAGPMGVVDVTVTTPVATSATSAADKFTFDQPGPPQVDGVDPNHGTKFGGTNVSIHGSGFTGATAVKFGSTSVAPCGPFPTPAGCFGVANDQNIFAASPPGTANTTVDVRVIVGTGVGAVTSAIGPGDRFTWDVPTAPVINAIDADHGSTVGGTNVTLFGSGFADPAISLTFGGTAMPSCPPPNPGSPCFGVSGDTNIFLTTPSHVGTGPVEVKVTTTAGSASTNYTYTQAAPPMVMSVSPASGPSYGGTTVWIKGSGFGGATQVTFGGNQARFQVQFQSSDTVIEATSPPGVAGPPVDVQVTTAVGTSAATANDQFTYTAAPPVKPVVTAISPSTTSAGDTIYITGANFSTDSASPSATQVYFGLANVASFNVISDTLISVTVPTGTGTVDVIVANTAGSSATGAADKFTYGSMPAPPVVSGVDPNQGTKYGGTNVTIYGRGFGSATSVAFGPTAIPSCSSGGASLCFLVTNDNQISVQNPPGAPGTVGVRVTSPSGQSPIANGDKFTFVTPGVPTLNAVDPSSGPSSGGTQVNIYGSALGGATAVAFGPNSIPPCSPSTFGPCFFIFGDNQIMATSPMGPPGMVDIKVTAPEGPSATSPADQYTYVAPQPPTVTKASPNTGGTSGGTIVYITGTNLLGATSVNFGPNATFNFFPMTANVIQAVSPPGVVGTVDITVTTPGGTSPPVPADRYTYTQSPGPMITAVSPSGGPSEGGTTVWITGTDLAPVNSLMFGTANLFNFFPVSSTLIQAVSPPQPAGPAVVDVSVTTPAGSSPPVAADQYTYAAGGLPTVTAVSPNTGPAGTPTFVSGNNFAMLTDVKFGATSAGFWFSPVPNVLTTASPPGETGLVDVKVSTVIGTSATSANDQYTYTATLAPVVVAVSPSSGPSGTHVLISGDNLNLFGPNDVVKFGGTRSPFFQQISQGVIRANSPPAAASATPVDITVTTSGGTSATSAADLYTFTAAAPPTVTWVSPNTGPAGTYVTITGTALGGATAVNFGNNLASNVFIRSDTLIRVPSPPGSGTVDVTVTTATGTSPTSAADKYSYLLMANAWEDHGGLLTSGPTASTWGSGRLDAFARGGDGQIWHRYLSAGTYYWEPLSGLQATSDAATVSTATGRIDVFVRGSDNALWQKTFSSGAWGTWTRLGGVLAGSPAVVSLGAGKLDVFAQGTDNHLWYDSFNGTTWTWNLAGGVLAAAPAAVSASAGTADAFVMGSDSQLWRYAAPSGTWSPLGGHLAVKPAATTGASGVLDVFVEGTDLHLWHWSNPGGTGSWELIGGLLSAAPAATSWGSGRLDVMVRGTDARLYHAWSSGGGWTWEGLGGQLIGSPAVVTWGVGRLDVFVRGTDNHLWHLSFGS